MNFTSGFAVVDETSESKKLGDRSAIGRLSNYLSRRLGLRPVAVAPDLVLIVKKGGEGMELSVRLPLPPGISSD